EKTGRGVEARECQRMRDREEPGEEIPAGEPEEPARPEEPELPEKQRRGDERIRRERRLVSGNEGRDGRELEPRERRRRGERRDRYDDSCRRESPLPRRGGRHGGRIFRWFQGASARFAARRRDDQFHRARSQRFRQWA